MIILLLNLIIWVSSGFLIARYGLRIRELLILVPVTPAIGVVLHFALLNFLLRVLDIQIVAWLIPVLMVVISGTVWLTGRKTVDRMTLSCSRQTAIMLLVLWLILPVIFFKASLYIGDADEVDHRPRSTLVSQIGLPRQDMRLYSYANSEYCTYYHYAENISIGALMRQSNNYNFLDIVAFRVAYNGATLMGLCFVFLWLLLKRTRIAWAVLGSFIFLTIGPGAWISQIHNISLINNLLPESAFFSHTRIYAITTNLIPLPGEYLFVQHGPDLMTPLVYYLNSPNPPGFWVPAFLALIAWLSLRRESHAWYWYVGLGALTALSALYYTTGLLLVAIPIGLYLLYQVYLNRQNAPRKDITNLLAFTLPALFLLLVQGGLITDTLFCPPIGDSANFMQDDKSLLNFTLQAPEYHTPYLRDRDLAPVQMWNPGDWLNVFADWGMGLLLYLVLLVYTAHRKRIYAFLILFSGLISIIWAFFFLSDVTSDNNYRLAILPLWMAGALSVLPLSALWEYHTESTNRKILDRGVVIGVIVSMSLTGAINLYAYVRQPESPSLFMHPVDSQVQKEWLGVLDPLKERVASPEPELESQYDTARAVTVFGTYAAMDTHYNHPDGESMAYRVWLSTLLPEDLEKAHYTCVYATGEWLNSLQNNLRENLFNPDYYQLLESWNDEETGDERHLFCVDRTK